MVEENSGMLFWIVAGKIFCEFVLRVYVCWGGGGVQLKNREWKRQNSSSSVWSSSAFCHVTLEYFNKFTGTSISEWYHVYVS